MIEKDGKIINEKVMREMNRYLEGTTVEEVLLKNRKLFHFHVMFTNEQMEQGVDVLDLSQRAYNCLRRNNIYTLGDLVNGVKTNGEETSKRRLLKFRNLGRKTSEEILLKMFYYQFIVLPEKRKNEYMQEVVLSNCR